MFFLGIETSCDETAVGIVDGTGRVLANVVATQVDVHARYGGIVPEVASRQHVLDIRPVCERAVVDAGLDWGDIDVVAPTHGPGLAGSLIVGLNFAKGLAASLNVPLVGVNHMDGHVYAAWAMTDDTAGLEPFQKKIGGRPIMCLVVSGGHTELVLLEGHGRFRLLGETRDDAAGEAFDKAARVLGLRYPGGPEIQRVAEGAPAAEPFPRAWMRGTDEFSFSGLKTAVINRARSLGIYPPPGEGMGGVPDPETVAGLARAFQESVVDVLVTKTIAAATRENCAGIVLAGGVAANRSLRETLVAESPLPVVVPPFELCTDNGAMIAMSGLISYRNGRRDDWGLDVVPGLRIGTASTG